MAEKKFSRTRGNRRDLPEHFVRDPRTNMILVRIRVPAECQPSLPKPHRGKDGKGKTELLYYFGTTDRETAIHREREQQVIYRFKAIIEAARPKPAKLAYIPPTGAEIERMREIIEIILKTDPHTLVDERSRKNLMSFQAQMAYRHVDGIDQHQFEVMMPHARFAMLPADMKEEGGREIIRFEAGVDMWADERKVVGPSRDQYKARFKEFAAKITHHDICNRVTQDDLIAYKGWLVTQRKEPKTIKNYVGNLRTVLQYLIDDKKIDPIDLRVKIVVKGNARTRRKQFENPDRWNIYTAAVATHDPLYRYGNLLPLFSGMRISEWAEADTRDIRKIDGVWVFCLDYDNKLLDDQTLKNDESIRKWPIHSAVLKVGFLKYVRSLPVGPLFPMLKMSAKYDRRRADASRLMGFWLRNVAGITDPKKVNHSHRHSCETLMMVHNVEKRLAYAVTGHAPADAGEAYLHPPVSKLKWAVEKIPIPTEPTEAEFSDQGEGELAG